MRLCATISTAALMLASVPASTASSCGAVKISQLSVDGRTDAPLGLGNPRPTLAWQMIQTRDCPESDDICPADRQTAYEIQAAATVDDLLAGRLIWKIWDALGQPSGWSRPSTWTIGLLDQSDWGRARWIDYPDRNDSQPLPLFARPFDIPSGKVVADARLYISGVGMHHATVNGEDATDEVLAPGYSNYQLSSEYRTYDVMNALRPGPNAVGVSLGNGPAYVRRNVRNPAVGRNAPYSWWESQLMGNGTLSADVATGSSNVRLSSVARYNIGGSINIDTGDGGNRLESRVITAIDNDTSIISFTPALEQSHEAGAKVTGSGNNIAASDPSAGAAVTPRFIARLEIMFGDGSSTIIVTDRSWRTALGPLVTDAWYSGSDYDARREQLGWDQPGTDLKPSAWTSAGIAPAPNLATRLVARAAELIKEQERFTPVSVTNPVPGIWVFDFGQNIVGWPLITLPELPAGVTIKVAPAEGLNANGTVNQASLGPRPRGSDLFNTYTTAGRAGGETWHPRFNYFGMQWVQVTGLPSGFEPGPELVTGIRLQADVPIADYTMPMGAIYRNFHVDGMLRTSMRHLVEGQSVADTPMAGNVALKTPVYDWGYSGRFGDEINWGNAIVFVPSFLHDLYDDTTVMSAYYDQMIDFVNYIQREKVQDHIVDAALADWVEKTAAPRATPLAVDIREAFNDAFFNNATGRYTSRGNDSPVNATQAAQALALDAGLVPSEHREKVLEALVDLVEFYPSADGEGPHLSGGTIGLGPIVRALSAGGRDDVLWAALQQDDRPSYGYFMGPTPENPDGFTTIGERWTRSDSKNHMILAQIDEWFHAGVAGIQACSLGTISATWADKLVFQPKPVGDLTSAAGMFRTRAGEARSEWTRVGDIFALSVTVPANTEAEVRVAGEKVRASGRATFVGEEEGYAVYTVPSGTHNFSSTLKGNPSWRALPLTRQRLETRLSQVHAYPNAPAFQPDANFFTTSLTPSISSSDSHNLTTQFYDHSLAHHTALPSSPVPGPVPGSAEETTSFLTTSTSFASNPPGAPPLPVAPAQQQQQHHHHHQEQPLHLSDLEDVPPAHSLLALHPQTVTLNLIAGVIAPSAPRPVRTRYGATLHVLELLLGDDTRAGFAVTFWLSAADLAAAVPSLVLRLRRRDVVMLRDVALHVFRGRVYGQSLRRGRTKVSLLHRGGARGEGAGCYSGADLRRGGHPQVDKTRRVRDWVLRFVGGDDEEGERGARGGKARRRGWDRPPDDTQ
ncbi:hypothetical protein ACHAP1_003267 [Verticillium nonalfalfae]